ncbi:MAG: YveK family protein [Ruminococcus sp.]
MVKINNALPNEISIKHLIEIILKKWYFIVTALILGAFAAFGYTYKFIPKQYTSDIRMYVNNTSISIGNVSAKINSGDLSAAHSLVDTYCVILKSRVTLEKIIEKADLDYTAGQLNNMISASAVNGTEVFSVSVNANSPEDACKIANTICLVLPEQLENIVEGSSVKIVDTAVEPATFSSPNYKKNTLIGALAAMMLVCVLIFAIDFFNDTIQSEDSLSHILGNIPIIGSVPDVRDTGLKSGYYGNEKRSADSIV